MDITPPPSFYVANLRGKLVTIEAVEVQLATLLRKTGAGLVIIDPHYKITATKKGTVTYRLVHLCPAAVEWLAGSERQKKDEQTGKTPLSPVWGVDRLRQLARETTPRIEVPGNARPPHAPDHAKRERITTAMK